MSVNASPCARCGLLSRDFSFEEQMKARPTCLSCLTGTSRHKTKSLRSSSQRTCTRCGSLKHVHADFTAEERSSKTPVCRTCHIMQNTVVDAAFPSAAITTTTTTTTTNHRLSSYASRHHHSSRVVLSKRQQRKTAHALEELEELTQQLEQAKVQAAAQQLQEEEREARIVPGKRQQEANYEQKTNDGTSNNSNNNNNNTTHQQRQGNHPQASSTSSSSSPEPTQKSPSNPKSKQQQQQQQQQSTAKTSAQRKMEQLKASYSKRDQVDEIQALYMALVETLLQPHRAWGVPLALRNKKDLFDYLTQTLDVYHEPTAWLVQPLLQGLLEYRDYTPSSPDEPPIPVQPNAKINVRIGFGKAASIFYSLLAWTCHDAYLQQACGWQGGSTMVQIVLASPGIHVNDVFFNKMHAGFFAVLYSSHETLQALVQAGLYMGQRDAHHRGLLYHTLEYPEPTRVRTVLNNLSNNNLHQDPDARECALHLLKIGSLALQVAAAQQSSSSSSVKFTLPACWNMLGGPPKLEHVAESLIVVRQRGVWLTAAADSEHELSKVLQTLNPFVEHFFVLHLTGQWLPKNIQQRIRVRDQDAVKQESGETVQVCQIHGLDTSQTVTTLACGHLFCHACVTEYNDANYQGRPLCPVCARRLSKDVMLVYPEMGLGSGHARHDLEHEQLKAFSFLNDAQMKHEAHHAGLQASFLSWSSSLRDQLLAHVLECHLQPPPAMMGGMSALLNLSATHTHVETHSHGVTLAPTHGPACVEIWIKGVPVLAHVNNTSRWTNVSSELVKMLNLEAMPHLTTTRMGIPVSCVRDLTFTLGNNQHNNSHNTKTVSVLLHNAVVVPSHLMRGMGISLGLDFFLSATYCCADVNVMLQEESAYTTRRGGIPTTMRCDGLFSWSLENMPSTNENLRYYARDGQMVTLPLYHFNTCRADQYELPTLFTLADAHQDEECYWCCRQFPKGCGMVHCQPCLLKGVEVPYCDERCQRAAESVHKACCGRLGTK